MFVCDHHSKSNLKENVIEGFSDSYVGSVENKMFMTTIENYLANICHQTSPQTL